MAEDNQNEKKVPGLPPENLSEGMAPASASAPVEEGAAPTDVPAEGAEAPKPSTSKRDALRDRLRKRYPDKSFDDDEELAGQISDDYDSSEKELSEYKDREKQIGDFLASDPKAAAFIHAWREGKNPVTALVDEYGIDFLEYMDDPEHQEELAEANKGYLERLAKEKQLEGEYQKNLDESLNALESAQNEKGWDDDFVNDGLEKLFEVVNDAIMGKISVDTIEMLNKAMSHDNDVAKAGEEGEIRGRNAKITEKLKSKKSDDGTPHLSGGGSKPKPQSGGGSIFDLASQAQ